jgi:uncharacterized protein (UPF0264 family)
MSGLVVSVRNAAEARIALDGGAALIDVKEPTEGSLGRAAPTVLASVLEIVAGNRPVSAAMGELIDWSETELPQDVGRLAYLKWGLSNCPPDWAARLTHLRTRIEGSSACQLVVTAYADWRRANAPPPRDVCHLAIQTRAKAFLLDTWNKDGTSLSDWVLPAEVLELRQQCRAAGVLVVLAGGLALRNIRELSYIQPDLFAVRGAVCLGGRRDGELDTERVRSLVTFLSAGSPTTPGG